MASSPLFGVIPAGQSPMTEPSSVPSPTSFLYELPTSKPFSHIVVFMLPGISIPADSAAAIYQAPAAEVAAAAQAGTGPNFRFMGAIGPGKESAVFKIVDAGAGIVLGISVEPASSVAPRLEELSASKSSAGSAGSGQPPTVVLAQRIIQNAFNFLSSFSGAPGPGGLEVVPLKAFEDWWRKFESRVRADPSFLEKQAN